MVFRIVMRRIMAYRGPEEKRATPCAPDSIEPQHRQNAHYV
ncbi:hypothetical protein C7S15_8080 [Burkholderia cepacia]|nr:hypothetical protein [Burkholderia cepacia]